MNRRDGRSRLAAVLALALAATALQAGAAAVRGEPRNRTGRAEVTVVVVGAVSWVEPPRRLGLEGGWTVELADAAPWLDELASQVAQGDHPRVKVVGTRTLAARIAWSAPEAWRSWSTHHSQGALPGCPAGVEPRRPAAGARSCPRSRTTRRRCAATLSPSRPTASSLRQRARSTRSWSPTRPSSMASAICPSSRWATRSRSGACCRLDHHRQPRRAALRGRGDEAAR